MKLAVIALTEAGKELAYRLEKLIDVDLYLSAKVKPREDVNTFDSSLKKLVSKLFTQYDGLIFIMALGIVVRVIAPYLEDKRQDPAIITIDETAHNVISTLSGHVGGANELTNKVASLIDANPVITTATDCQEKLAFDLLAKELNCELVPWKNLKLANAALVNGEQVNIFTDLKLDLNLAEEVGLYSLKQLGRVKGFPIVISNQNIKITEPYLQLVPQNIVVGIGCRRGVSASQIKEAIFFALQKLDLHQASTKKLSTIDLKEDEAGIIETAKELDIPVEIITREEIKEADLNYTRSEFVKEQIGVGGVCEPAAQLSVQRGELLLSKTSQNQVTVAVMQENFM
ncbi:cobalt-precorrin 5A hydrolase [Halanaerobaculum tunisiense]